MGRRTRAGTRYGRLLLVAAALMAVLLTTPVARASSVDQAVGYQEDSTHDGYVSGFSLDGALAPLWSETVGDNVSYPLIVNGAVYVTSDDPNALTALNAATGATLWSQPLGGTYGFSAIAYASGRIFAVNYDGLLSAFDATTGALIWSVSLPGQYGFDSPPVVADGLVFIDGGEGGDTLAAVEETNGVIAWTNGHGGESSSPAISGASLYTDDSCANVDDLDSFSGELVWQQPDRCPIGISETSVFANGDMYVTDGADYQEEGSEILSGADGSEVAPLPSDLPPAVGDGMAFELEGGTLSGIADSGTGATVWRFAGDGQLDSTPLLVDDLVFVGSAGGELYALEESTGAVEWSTQLGGIEGPSDSVVPQPGLAAGGGVLAVPTGNSLTVYAPTATLGVIPSAEVQPTVSGVPRAGEPVAVDTGVWAGTPSGYGYQWLQCDATGVICTPLVGAVDATYTPTAAEIGDTLKVQVTATDTTGLGLATTSASAPIVETTPRNPGIPADLPSISGDPSQGSVLTADPGTWDPSPPGFDYQWIRCNGVCFEISGATNSTYTPTSADVGDGLEVAVAPADPGGESPAEVSTPQYGAIAPALPPVNQALPSISGDPEYPGGTLTAYPGAWTNYPSGYDYQWFDCRGYMGSCSAIPGATASTYDVVQSDVGENLEVGVVATNPSGASPQVISNDTEAVVTTLPVNTEPPSVSGNLVVGLTLSVSSGEWSNSPTSFSYRWLRCNPGCNPIPGATSNTYTISSADGGASLEAQVLATNGNGTSEPATSSPELVPEPVTTTVTPTASSTSTTTPTVTTKTTVPVTTVTKKPATLAFTARLEPTTLSTLLKRGLRVAVRCASLCEADLSLSAAVGAGHRTVVIATLRAALLARSSRTLVITVKPAETRAIRRQRLRALTLTLASTVTGAAGARGTSVHSVTLHG